MTIEALRRAIAEFDSVVAERDRLRADLERIAKACKIDVAVPSRFSNESTTADIVVAIIREAKVDPHRMCNHRHTESGPQLPRVPLLYGSAAIERCQDCGAWRMLAVGHEGWRRADELEAALKREDDA